MHSVCYLRSISILCVFVLNLANKYRVLIKIISKEHCGYRAHGSKPKDRYRYALKYFEA